MMVWTSTSQICSETILTSLVSQILAAMNARMLPLDHLLNDSKFLLDYLHLLRVTNNLLVMNNSLGVLRTIEVV